MAHASHVNALIDELVQSVTSCSSTHNARTYRACKEAASKTLKHHRYGRTNQFSVQNSLKGLVEKFHILNNDVLASTLEERLHELTLRSTNWTPEILSLLLQLSDRPADRAHTVGGGEEPEEPEEQTPLTWAEILVDDPVADPELWRTDDFSSFTSDSEKSSINDHSKDNSQSSTHKNSTTEQNLPNSYDLIVPLKPEALSQVKATAELRAANNARSQVVSELLIIREVLYMLQGLPTTLFVVKPDSGDVHPTSGTVLDGVSLDALKSILLAFSRIGTCINTLRIFGTSTQTIPLNQILVTGVFRRVCNFAASVRKFEERFVNPRSHTVASLLVLSDEVFMLARFPKQLGNLVDNLKPFVNGLPWRILDELHTKTCSADLIGDISSFIEYESLLSECVKIYLHDVANWMQFGELTSGNTLSFVVQNQQEVSFGSFWHDCYTIERARAPAFLLPVIDVIFSSGKNVAFMRELGLKTKHTHCFTSTFLNLDLISRSSDGKEKLVQLPFHDRFSLSIETWIQSRHQPTWLSLREFLLVDGGLLRTIDALHTIYLSKDGAVFEDICNGLFSRLDSAMTKSTYALSMDHLLKDSFGSSESVEVSRLSVKISSNVASNSKTVKIVNDFSFIYQLSLSIQNIIQPYSTPIYNRMLQFLLQIRRAKYVLYRHRFLSVSRPQNQNSTRFSSTYQTSRDCTMIRHRLVWCITVLEDHIIHTAITGPSLQLHESITKATGIDSMVEAHNSFASALELKGLLSKHLESIHGAVLSILDLAILTADIMSRLILPSASSDTTLIPRVKQIRRQFDSLLALLIASLWSAARGIGGDASWAVLAERLECDLKGSSASLEL